MEEKFRQGIDLILKEGSTMLASYALTFAGALVTLIVGFTIAGILSRWTRRGLENVDAIDDTLTSFLAKMVKYAIWVLVIVTVLAQFGVKTTSLIAMLGAAGLAIGLALQGTLANIASGLMLLVLRPFKIGEYIDANGISGTVTEVGLFCTQLTQPNGLFVMAPNSQLWNRSIVNYSRLPERRFELIVGIGYGDDMKEARESLLALAKADERVLDTPKPVAFVNSLDDSSVGIGMRVWCKSEVYLALSWDLTEKAKARFDEVGISIPYPQREYRELKD